MHNSFPYGIDNIILELIRRGHLIPLEDLKNRKFYLHKGHKTNYFKWILHKAYDYTIGWFWTTKTSIPENTPLVSVSYLNVIDDNMVVGMEEISAAIAQG